MAKTLAFYCKLVYNKDIMSKFDKVTIAIFVILLVLGLYFNIK